MATEIRFSRGVPVTAINSNGLQIPIKAARSFIWKLGTGNLSPFIEAVFHL